MDVGHTVRPVLCTTGYQPCAGAFFGSGILVKREAFYFVTAFHVLQNHGKKVSDLRVIARLGSEEVIPQRRGIRAELDGSHNFEDLLVVRLDADFVRTNGLVQQFWPLSRADCSPCVGATAIVLGFPEEEQAVDIDNNSGTYCPVHIKGTVSEVDDNATLIVVATPPSIPLSSFNQFSGSAVFVVDPKHPIGVSMVGIVLQGGRSASILRALGSVCLLNLIEHYESTHLSEDVQKDRTEFEARADDIVSE